MTNFCESNNKRSGSSKHAVSWVSTINFSRTSLQPWIGGAVNLETVETVLNIWSCASRGALGSAERGPDRVTLVPSLQ
jgi:hypothetical protein